MTTNIRDVNLGTGETSAASAEVLNAAKMLSLESERLRSELNAFMGGIRAA